MGLAREMVDANEGAIALDLISDMLAKTRRPIRMEVFREFQELGSEMDLSPATADRLRPLIEN
ncbi:MAG: hypothetical protein AUH85_03215 [Chloroflexi bacterium 13_1_40CM_4_68_4]|nr:MAG: hypothetical protein AUH85_03215 [Chloroflexi bacterium 13_1_40CM_4_68_4]